MMLESENQVFKKEGKHSNFKSALPMSEPPSLLHSRVDVALWLAREARMLCCKMLHLCISSTALPGTWRHRRPAPLPLPALPPPPSTCCAAALTVALRLQI